jgi:hypothetical protein
MTRETEQVRDACLILAKKWKEMASKIQVEPGFTYAGGTQGGTMDTLRACAQGLEELITEMTTADS